MTIRNKRDRAEDSGLGDQDDGEYGRIETLGGETFRVFHFHQNVKVALTERRAAPCSGKTPGSKCAQVQVLALPLTYGESQASNVSVPPVHQV